ncbi:hypothetical protein FHS21_003928 [Phyllobacterium trifolii]|uniref:Uncharacterized protein n=1 Tax=Phyllobacterium trifolii TaxID=300193 RepID=A0A839U9I5_9HYPH|nr:hypothetical protein [Phyllobacterium trifolii]MBB3147508.1 hypothetical protein [Phyllobacterium trifolii]
MLTLKHPELAPLVYGYPGGLLPIRHPESGKLLLVIKARKEYILAARLNSGFSFYLAPLMSTSGLTVALTAFFDDYEEPLVIQTGIFNDPDGKDILELLGYGELDIHFLDEHNREWMSYRATLRDGGSVIAERTPIGLLTYHNETVTGIYAALTQWFGHRTTADDDKAIKVVFKDELFPSDIFITDIRPEVHDYLGSGGHSRSTLEREDAGYFQERDIVLNLKSAFRGPQIALNPVRRDTGKELVDVMAGNSTHLVLIQAKDSPNTGSSLARTLDRKRRTSQNQIEKAVNQAKGAAKYVRGHDILELTVDDNDLDVEASGKSIVSLIIVQEMFLDEGSQFVARYREMQGLVDFFVMLDYSAFSQFCYEFPNDQDLLAALTTYSSDIVKNGIWIEPQAYVINHRKKRMGR